LPVGLNQAPRN